MASMLFHQSVKDYAAWKKTFDSMAGARANHGALSDQIFRDAGDPNKVTIILKWDSLEKAKKYAQSPELREAMQKAGVEGPPQIHYLNEV